MKDLKEICELIEKNEGTEIEIKSRFDVITICLDCKFFALLNAEGFKILKENLLLNSSLIRIRMNNFLNKSSLSKTLESLPLQRISQLAFIDCRLDLKHLAELLVKNSLTEFQLVSTPLSPEDVDSISKILSCGLKTLKLQDSLSENNVQSVIKMIENCKTLTNLDLSFNPPEFYKKILPIVPQTVNELCLSVKDFVADPNLSVGSGDAGLISDAMKENKNIKKLIIIFERTRHTLIYIEKCTSLLKIPNVTSLVFNCPILSEQSIKLFLEALSKSKNLMELYIGNKRYTDKIYEHCAAVQVLIAKRVAKDAVKKVLSFLVNDKDANELAYNAYAKRKLLKFSPGPVDASSIQTEIKKEREEAKQVKKV